MFNKKNNFPNPTKGGFTKETKNTFSHMDMISNDWDFDKDPNEEEEIDPVYLYDSIKPKTTSYYSEGINRDGDYLSELAKGDQFQQRKLTEADYASVSSVHRESFLRNAQDIPRDTSGRPGANIQQGFGSNTNRLNSYYDDGYGESIHEPERRTVPLFTRESFSDGTENITSSFDSDNYGDGTFDFNPFDKPVSVAPKTENTSGVKRLSSISYDNFNNFEDYGETNFNPSTPVKNTSSNFDSGNFGGGNFDSGNFGGGNFDSGNFGGGNFDSGNFGGGNFGGGNFGGGNFDSGNFGGDNFGGGNLGSSSFGSASYGSSNFSGMNTTSAAGRSNLDFEDLSSGDFNAQKPADDFGGAFEESKAVSASFGSSYFSGDRGVSFETEKTGLDFADLENESIGAGSMTTGSGGFGSGSFVGSNNSTNKPFEGFDLATAIEEDLDAKKAAAQADEFDDLGGLDSGNFGGFGGGKFGSSGFSGTNRLSSGYENNDAKVEEDLGFDRFASEVAAVAQEDENTIINEPVAEETETVAEETIEEATEEVLEENIEKAAEEIVEEVAEEIAEETIQEPEKVIEEVSKKAETNNVATAYGSTDYASMYGTGEKIEEEAPAKAPVEEEKKHAFEPIPSKYPAFGSGSIRPAEPKKEEPKKEEKPAVSTYKPGGIFSLDFGEEEDKFAHLRLHSNHVSPVARDVISEINRFGESTPVEKKDDAAEENKVSLTKEEAVEETVEETVEEAVEETVEEVVEEPTEEIVEEITEEVVEEIAEEVAEEAAEDVIEEASEEIVEETTEETVEEVIEEAAEEVVEVVVEEVVEETIEETAEEVIEESTEESTEEVVEEVVEEVTEEVADEVVEETIEEVAEEVIEEAVEEAAEEIAEEAVEEVVEEAAEEVVEEAVEEAAEEITEEVVEEVVEEAVEEAAEEIAEEAVEEVVEEAVEEVVEETAGETIEELVEEQIEEVVEENVVQNETFFDDEAAEEVVEETVEEFIPVVVEEPAVIPQDIKKAKQKVVVSLGHAALDGHTTLEQLDSVKKTSKVLADLIEDNCQLTITHSNGQQVSMIHKAMTELRRVYIDYTPAPMCVCSAMSQGYVGYDIQNSLRAELLDRGISKTVSTILTQVTVDPYDEAFYEPTKEIGRFMSADDAETEKKKGNYVKEYPGKGFRRVVAAPKPMDIVEIEAIRALANADQAVIACGGGGIPVIEQKHALKGASAVIEKDAIAGRLAAELKSDVLLIITGVDNAYTGFGTDAQSAIWKMNVAEAKDYIATNVFEAGTMLPKIEAAIDYLTAYPEGKVIITSLDKADDAIKGKAGTVITA